MPEPEVVWVQAGFHNNSVFVPKLVLTPFFFFSCSDLPSMRLNMSLPVSPCSLSPCSSPLRQFKQTNRSCLPSPHSYYLSGAANQSPVKSTLYPTRPSNKLPDPWLDIALFKPQAPYNSPRRSNMGLWSQIVNIRVFDRATACGRGGTLLLKCSSFHLVQLTTWVVSWEDFKYDLQAGMLVLFVVGFVDKDVAVKYNQISHVV